MSLTQSRREFTRDSIGYRSRKNKDSEDDDIEEGFFFCWFCKWTLKLYQKLGTHKGEAICWDCCDLIKPKDNDDEPA